MADYFDLPQLISLILLIIPFTSWLFGILTRFKDGAIIAGIIRIFFGFNIIWIIEIVLTLLNGCQVKVLRILQC